MNGTQEATFVFWSPDSRSLGYVAAGELRRVDVDGGASQTICEIANFAGPAWLDSDSIVFSSFTGSGGRVMRVADRRGMPVEIARTMPSRRTGSAS